MYCIACQALMRESLLILGNKHSEMDVIDAIDQVLKNNPFKRRKDIYNENIMLGSCHDIIAGWNDDLERFL